MVGKDKIIELLTQQFGDRVDAPTKDYLGDVVIDSVYFTAAITNVPIPFSISTVQNHTTLHRII